MPNLIQAKKNDVTYYIKDSTARADMTNLKAALTTTISKNLIGPDPSVLYPVELHAGDVITLSSSNNSVGTVYRFRTYDENGNRTHYWDIPGAQSTPYRVLSMLDDAYYISWEHVTTAEFTGIPQCERGNVKTDFVPWIGNSKYFLSRMDKIIKIDGAASRVMNVGKNLVGGEKWVYYPVFLNAGDVITFSVQSPIEQYSEIYFHDKDFRQIEYWSLAQGATKRTVTIIHDGVRYICLHSDNLTISNGVLLQIEWGDEATQYEPYRDVTKATQDLIIKQTGLKKPFKIYDFLKDASQYRKGVANSSWHDRFVLMHMSDNHVGTEFAENNLIELSELANEVGFDAIVNSGDMTIAGGYSERSQTIQEFNSFTSALTQRVNSTIPILATLGNHDANDISDAAIASASTKQDQWSAVFAPIAEKYPSIVWGDSQHYRHYHYIDINKGGYILRVITLDSLDHADYVSGDRSYIGHATEVYSQAQMNWLCNVALNVPSHYYGVIINNHFPFAPDRANYSEEWAALKDGTFAQGWDMIPKIIRAWVNRGTLSESFTDAKLGKNNITINADFSTVPSGAMFVCFMTGHTHSKNVYTVKQEGGENYGQLMLCEDSSGQQGSALNKAYKYDNGIQNTAASQVTIDMAERKIYRTAYGVYQHSSEQEMKRTEIFEF